MTLIVNQAGELYCEDCGRSPKYCTCHDNAIRQKLGEKMEFIEVNTKREFNNLLIVHYIPYQMKTGHTEFCRSWFEDMFKNWQTFHIPYLQVDLVTE